MAGSSVTVTVSPSVYQVGYGGHNEVVVSLACLSDDADGSIPDQDLGSVESLSGLKAYELNEVITVPDDTATPATAYRVKIVDSDGRKIFIGSARAVGVSAIAESQSGHEYLGYFPAVVGTLTVSFIADDGATEDAADVGNEKVLTVKLRFVKRG